jgi:hypothetical protein
MQVSDVVKGFFASRERTNILATTSKDGKVNVAAFGSPALEGDSQISMMLGDNRSFANLSENPYGAFLVIMHGGKGMGMQGCRLYVKVAHMEDSGPGFDRRMEEIRARIGDGANMLKHFVLFDVLEARPILDFGQDI